MKKSLIILFFAGMCFTACRQDNRPFLQPAEIPQGVWTNSPEYTADATEGVMMVASEHAVRFAAFDYERGVIGDFQEQETPRYEKWDDGTLVCRVDLADRDVRFAYMGNDYSLWWAHSSAVREMTEWKNGPGSGDEVPIVLNDEPIIKDPPSMGPNGFEKFCTIFNGMMSVTNLALAIYSLATLSNQSKTVANQVLKNCREMQQNIAQFRQSLKKMFEVTIASLSNMEIKVKELSKIQDITERQSRLHYLMRTIDDVQNEMDYLHCYSMGYALAADSIQLAYLNNDAACLMELDKLLSAWAGEHADYVERTKNAIDKLITTRGMGEDVTVLTGMPALYKQYGAYVYEWKYTNTSTWTMACISDYIQILPSVYLSLLYCDVKKELHKESQLLNSYRSDINRLMKQMNAMYDMKEAQAYLNTYKQECLIPGCEFLLDSMVLCPVDFDKLNYWENNNGELVYNLVPGMDAGVAQERLLTAAEAKILAENYPTYPDMYTILTREAWLVPGVKCDSKKQPVILLQGNIIREQGVAKALGSGVLDYLKSKSSDYYPINDSRYQWYTVYKGVKK